MIILDPVLLNDTPLSRNSPGGLYDGGGRFVTAGPNEVRVTYDPMNLGLPPYALLEEGTFNHLVSSENLDTNAWAKPGCLIFSNNTVSPRGDMTADKLVAQAMLNSHYMEQNQDASLTPLDLTKTYTRSFHIKAAEMWKVRIETFSRPNSGIATKVVFNAQNGTFSSPNLSGGATQSYKAEALPNGWWRVSQTFSLNSPDNEIYCRIAMIEHPTSELTTFWGDGNSGVYLWGMQLEEGTTATSYFPTPPNFTSRGSLAHYYDENLALKTVVNEIPRYSYDPKSPGGLPRLMVEWGATNFIRNNTMVGATPGVPFVTGSLPTNWMIDVTAAQKVEIMDVQFDAAGYAYVDVRFSSTNNDRAYAALYFEPTNGTGIARGSSLVGQYWAGSAFFKLVSGVAPASNMIYVRALNTSGAETGSYGTAFTPIDANEPLGRGRISVLTPGLPANSNSLTMFYIAQNLPIGGAYDFTIRVGLPQLEFNETTSPIKTNNGGVNPQRFTEFASYAQKREPDVLSPVPGLVYSSVPETEAAYDSALNYAKGALVRTANNEVYESLVDANTTELTNKLNWLNKGPTNRRAMFDEQNNTQTTANDEVIVVLSARTIAQGVYLGNLDANEVQISMTAPGRGLVYSEIQSLIKPRSGSSFFKWCFGRISRRNWFLTLQLPVFADALVTLRIRKPGNVVKCGMAMIGPAVDVGLAQYGLATELKDYSSVTFNMDGTSTTVKRGYALRMSVDLELENERVEDVQDALISYRQKVVVWVGATARGDAILCGKYSSFRKVIESVPLSKMSLQIEGVVS